MGGAVGSGYDFSWEPVDGDGPGAGGVISNPKAWLKKALHGNWDLTR